MADEDIKASFEALTRRLHSDVELQVQAAAGDVLRLLEERQAAAVAARQAAEQELTDAVTAAREEERAIAAEALAVEEARAESAVAEALTRARAEATQQMKAELDAALARVREEAFQQARVDQETALTRAREEALEQARVDQEAAVVRAREEALQHATADRDAAVARARGEAEEAIAARLAEARVWREGDAERFDRVRRGVRHLDEARSLSRCLTALAESLAAETSRAAVFLVHGDRLRGWRFIGFGPDEGRAAAFDAARDAAGLVGRALAAGDTCRAQGATESIPALAQLPSGRTAVAVPLIIGNRSVGVAYADDGGTAEVAGAPWTEVVDLLTRYAARCLESLTAVRTAQLLGGVGVAEEDAGAIDGEAGARRHAKLLVSEIKLYNQAAVKLGRQHRDLAQRLRPEIDRARRRYDERVAPDVRASGTYFDDELVRTLADGDPSLLGEELAL